MKVLPTSLQPVNSASKRLHRLKVQRVKAESTCREALNSTLPKVQPVKTAPRVTASVRSTWKNSQPTKCRSTSSSPYQSSWRKVSSSVGSGIRPG